MKQTKHSKKGFTLIELIVVLAILAIVAAIAVPTAFGAIDKARMAADKASVDAFNSAIRTAYTIHAADPEGTYPTIGAALADAGLVTKANDGTYSTTTKCQYSKTSIKPVYATGSSPMSLEWEENGSATAVWTTVIGTGTLAKAVNATS